MKRFLITLIALSVFGCGPTITRTGPQGDPGLPGAPGTPGQPGQDGNDGHSLVTLSPGTLPIICVNGGSAIDIYLDVDDDLVATINDLYQSTVFACNGSNGQDGEDGETGPPGPPGSSGTMVAINFPSDTSCRNIGGGYYARKQNSSSDTVRVYADSSCVGTVLQSMTSSGNEVFWTSPTNGYYLEGVNATGITVYRFSL
jgi:hypothetical protein